MYCVNVPAESLTHPIHQAHYQRYSAKHHCLLTSVGLGEVLWLSFFGYLAHTAPEEDHHRVIAAALRPPADWRRPVGRLRTTWLRTIDDDL